MGKKLVIQKDPRSKGDGEIITGNFNSVEAVEKDFKKAKLEMLIAERIGTVLVKKYNNRQWKVIVDIPGRMLIIACDSISNNKGYHIKMSGRNIQQLQQRAVFAAGEILERHNLARTKQFDPDIFETLPRDLRDNVIAIDAKVEPI